MEIDNINTQSLVDKTKLSIQAMEIRLALKNDEINLLKTQIMAKQDVLSLQFHAINQMEKPLLVDQSILAHLSELKQLLELKKKDLDEKQTENNSYTGRPFKQGQKLHNLWLSSGEDAYHGIKDFAEGPVQDLVLQVHLCELKIQELDVRVKESKELYEGLEKESQEQKLYVSEYQTRYKNGLEQLELLTQENFKLKRNV